MAKTLEEPEKVPAPAAPDMPPLRGRAAFAAQWARDNGEGEPDDDTLFDYAHGAYNERDELRGKYDTLNGANEKLASVIGEDPRFAQFIAMVANGENLMYALGKTFGNIIDELDDESLEKLRAGQEEYKAYFNKVKANFSNYEAALKTYASEHQLSDEQVAEIDDNILAIAQAFNDREIDTDVIDIVYKGLDYDANDDAKLSAAELAGRNSAIDDIKAKKKPAGTLPDIGGQRTNLQSGKRMDIEQAQPSLKDAIVDKDW